MPNAGSNPAAPRPTFRTNYRRSSVYRCEVKRHGMYTTGTNSAMDRAVSQCGEIAEFHADKTYEGRPQYLCRAHALREERSGFKVERLSDQPTEKLL